MAQTWTIDEIDPSTTSPSSDISKLVDGHDANRSNFSGASDPSTAVAFQIYANTTDGVFKQRDSSDSTWGIIASTSATPVTSVSSNTTLGVSSYNALIIADATNGEIIITLPSATDAGNGWSVTVKKVDSSDNSVFIFSGSSIDGTSTVTIVDKNSVVGVRSSGSTYYIYSGAATGTIGSTGSTSTIPQSIPAPLPIEIAGDGNLVELDQWSVSEVSSTDITGLITEKYANYLLRYNIITDTVTTSLTMQASSNGGSSYISTDYSYVYRYRASNQDAGFLSSGQNVDYWTVADIMSVVETGDEKYTAAGAIKIYNMLSSSQYKMTSFKSVKTNSNGMVESQNGGGRLASTTAMDAFQLSMTSGTMTGKFIFFGVET